MSYRHPGGLHGTIDGRFTDRQFTDPANTRAGSANGLRGIVPSRTVWNLSLGYDTKWKVLGLENLSLFLAVRNLFDLKYIDGRICFNFGICPGAPRTFEGGLRFKW